MHESKRIYEVVSIDSQNKVVFGSVIRVKAKGFDTGRISHSYPFFQQATVLARRS